MLTFKTLLPGLSASAIILSVMGTSLFSLFLFAIKAGDFAFYLDDYLLHVLLITFFQAFLSALLSLTCALLMAKALSLVNFRGKSLLIRIMPVTFILPSLVVVTGLLSVYGQHGLITKVCEWLDIRFFPSIYGLKGILLAHLFLNFPYASRLFYQTLMTVPIEQKQLAAQLNFSHYTFFKIVEWPLLRRQILPTATLIFMLCFSSFAVVLALGGGPKYSTLEVAIYQAIRDFELFQALILTCLQLFCCILLMGLTRKISHTKRINTGFYQKPFFLSVPTYLLWISYLIVLVSSLFILTPLVSLFIDGVRYFKFSLLTNDLFKSIGYSIIIALCSSVMSLLLAGLLLWTNSRLLMDKKVGWSHQLMLVGTLILAIPSMVLASGLYLLLFEYADNFLWVCLLMIICNGFMALPFVLKNLETPMYDMAQRYIKISQLLNITGLTHFYLIEFKALKRLMMVSFAFASILSLGDFGIIALFGGQSVITLPYYLYEQISNYHYQDGSVTALILLMLSLSLLLVIDNDKT